MLKYWRFFFSRVRCNARLNEIKHERHYILNEAWSIYFYTGPELHRKSQYYANSALVITTPLIISQWLVHGGSKIDGVIKRRTQERQKKKRHKVKWPMNEITPHTPFHLPPLSYYAVSQEDRLSTSLSLKISKMQWSYGSRSTNHSIKCYLKPESLFLVTQTQKVKVLDIANIIMVHGHKCLRLSPWYSDL